MTAEPSDASQGNLNGMYLEAEARNYYIKYSLKILYFFFARGFLVFFGFSFSLCNQKRVSVEIFPSYVASTWPPVDVNT